MNDITTPLFSIITPVYNSADYLKKCINSVLAQTQKSWELLLIDDGST
ncbi:glycosyltransferase family 2 protein, partial [Riemerella anatipestifer]